MNKFKQIGIPAIVLTSICLVVSILVAYSNRITAPKIEELAKKNKTAAMALVVPDGKDFTNVDGIAADRGEVYKCEKGYAIITSAKGYGGQVQVMTGVSNDGSITGVTILSHNETPGLGAKSVNPEFKDQYVNKNTNEKFEVVKSGASKDTDIQAISGATITSKAVTSAVNQAVELYNSVAKGGKSNG